MSSGLGSLTCRSLALQPMPRACGTTPSWKAQAQVGDDDVVDFLYLHGSRPVGGEYAREDKRGPSKGAGGAGSAVIIGRSKGRVDDTVAELTDRRGQAWGIAAELTDRSAVTDVQRRSI